jgi:hypothetical protein
MGIDWVDLTLRWFRLVTCMRKRHMRKGMANGVITVPPRDFEFQSGWYYRTYEVSNS